MNARNSIATTVAPVNCLHPEDPFGALQAVPALTDEQRDLLFGFETRDIIASGQPRPVRRAIQAINGALCEIQNDHSWPAEQTRKALERTINDLCEMFPDRTRLNAVLAVGPRERRG